MNTRDILTSELRKNSYSVTSARLAVCEALSQLGPCTMHDLIDKLHGKTNRATIYRVITLFESISIVKRIQIGWKYKLELSDVFTDHHHHAHCHYCDQMITLSEDNRLETAIYETVKNEAFTVTGHTLEIHGLCENCSK